MGWKLIALGNGIGFLFALLVLTISAVSFRLCSIAMLERRSHFGQTGIRESGQGHRRGVTPFGALAPATSCRACRKLGSPAQGTTPHKNVSWLMRFARSALLTTAVQIGSQFHVSTCCDLKFFLMRNICELH